MSNCDEGEGECLDINKFLNWIVLLEMRVVIVVEIRFLVARSAQNRAKSKGRVESLVLTPP
jgi:hypothetical protein